MFCHYSENQHGAYIIFDPYCLDKNCLKIFFFKNVTEERKSDRFGITRWEKNANQIRLNEFYIAKAS